MDIQDLVDLNASYYIDKAKEGYRRASFHLFYSLKKSIKEDEIGPVTKQVIIDILLKFATLPECEKKIFHIYNTDSSQLIELLINEVKTDSLTPVSKFLLTQIFNNLQVNEKLGRKAIGIKPGKRKDPIKRASNIRLAILVLYYKEKTNLLNTNSKRDGAFFLAAAHANNVKDPTEEQEKAARQAWDSNKESAQIEWKAISDRFAERGCKPIPKDDYKLSSVLDEYLG